jgi:predicted HTH transcriptional regulator
MEYMREHPRSTQLEIANAVVKSRRTVQDAIAGLREQGLIKREGARKNGRWVVKPDADRRSIHNQ